MRPVLIALDAFGTLFSPKSPIGHQYAAVAAEHGVRGLRSDDIESSFYTAFKAVSRRYPNYGKYTDISLEDWWRSVISGTFQPHVSQQQLSELQTTVVPALIQRFWCAQGYALHEDALQIVQQVKELRHSVSSGGPIILGVISNSDTRVPDVLTSFGYKVGALRILSNPQIQAEPEDSVDFQFVVHSYDVGFEKPAKGIFDAAEDLVRQSLLSKDFAGNGLLKLYIGDEMKKDGVGAQNAGWHSIIVDRADEKLPVLGKLSSLVAELSSLGDGSPPTIRSVSTLTGTKTS